MTKRAKTALRQLQRSGAPLDLSARLSRGPARAIVEHLQVSTARTTKRKERSASGAGTDAHAHRARTDGCTAEEAADWIKILSYAESKFRWKKGLPRDAGWVRWNDFFKAHPDYRPKRQLARELYLAKQQLGDRLFRKALLSVGLSKTARLRRFRTAKRSEAEVDRPALSDRVRIQLEQMLDHGVIIRRGEAPRLLREFPLNQFLALIRLAGGGRFASEGGREFRWPESLISRTRSLITDWSQLDSANVGYDAYLGRQREESVRAEQIKFLKRLRSTLSKVGDKLARWLERAKKAEAGAVGEHRAPRRGASRRLNRG